MTNAVIECIQSRSATKYFDPAATLSDEQIRELVRIGTTAPTSFHLQNWRFIAVRTPEAKARLRPLAWDQPAITEAAVTFIVCGQLADSSVVPERLAPLVEAGIMPAKMVPEWEIPARDLYMEYPQRQRDEAVRTGTFGAAAMIYAARSLGLGSTPMIGFDAEAVHREFGLAEDEVPVMLLSVGPERPGNWAQKPRRPVADVLDHLSLALSSIGLKTQQFIPLEATAFLDREQAPLAREKALAALDLTVMGELRGVDGCPAVLSGTGTRHPPELPKGAPQALGTPAS